MRRPLRTLSTALSARLRRLDERLGLDHSDRGEWIWAAPLGTLLGTVALVCAVGVSSGVGPALYVPIAVILGVVMLGMSVSYMTPRADVEPGDDSGGGDGGGGAPSPLAPAWYRRLFEATREEPAPRPRETLRR